MIKIEVKINTITGVDVKKSIIKYFVESGFKQFDINNQKLKFNRGSLTSNMWTFNPLKWKSEIIVEILEQEIITEFNIDTTGQIPTRKEELLWDNFIENYKKYLIDNTFDFKNENRNLISSTKMNSLKYVGWAFIGGIIGGIPAGIIGYLIGINSFAAIGASLGAMFFLFKKINDDKLKAH